MKRLINGLLIRFALLIIAIGCGWFAVAHAQKGLAPGDQQQIAEVPPQMTALRGAAPMPDPAPADRQLNQWAAAQPIQPVEPVPLQPAPVDQAPVEPQFDEPQLYPQNQYAAEEPEPTIQRLTAEEDLGYGAVPDLAPPDAAPIGAPDSGFEVPPVSETQQTEADGFALPPLGQAPAELPSEPEQSPQDFAAPPAEQEFVTQPAQPTYEYQAPSEPSPQVVESTTPAQIAPGARFAPEPEPVPQPETAVATPATGIPGTGKPDVALEGPQTPVLTLSKQAPREIQVGKRATYEITVRNTGSVTAHEVLIRDEVPYGTSLLETNPPANQSADAGVQWHVGALAPGGESTVTMTVMPEMEGEIGSVATVTFQAAASAKSISTRPQLTVEHTGPRKVLVGDDVIFHITVANPGTGVATNVTIEEDVPVGLRHTAGAELVHNVGDIKPHETRVLELTLKADRPGEVDNLLVARADAGLVADHNFQLEVVAPLMKIGIKGPHRRYLDREARFEIMIANPGTAAAKNVDLVSHMPSGLEFVSANNAGQYNSQTHTVHWSLAELPPNEMGSVELVAKPRTIGDQKIRVDAKAQMNLSDKAEHVVQVDGVAALLFTVKDLADPIEVGGKTSYEIRVVNQGSKTATNLQLGAMVPDGMQAIRGEGPVRGVVDGQTIIFEPLQRLLPQGETIYRLHVKGTSPGDMRLKVQLKSDELTQPVTKEVSTHVYADE